MRTKPVPLTWTQSFNLLTCYRPKLFRYAPPTTLWVRIPHIGMLKRTPCVRSSYVHWEPEILWLELLIVVITHPASSLLGDVLTRGEASDNGNPCSPNSWLDPDCHSSAHVARLNVTPLGAAHFHPHRKRGPLLGSVLAGTREIISMGELGFYGHLRAGTI